jgi:hypothetical protein
MTPDQFRQKWMTLAYNRIKHEGRWAEFPPDRADWKRPAFGRNGVGRHGLLCFNSEYEVESRRDGLGGRFVVGTASGHDPFVLKDQKLFKAEGHGTRLSSSVARNLPSADRILEMLAARYLHDPRFTVEVNGSAVDLTELSGFLDEQTVVVSDTLRFQAYFIDSTKAARSTRHQGIAFWVGGRLVGIPSWVVGFETVLDGRTRFAKRYAVVIKTDSLFEDVLPDWTGFKQTPAVAALQQAVIEYVERMFYTVSAARIQDTTEGVYRDYRSELSQLRPSALHEVADFVTSITSGQPTIPYESLSVAVQAIIRLEKTRSGASLLEKLSRLSPEDVTGLDRLLGEWSIRDALTVLDEIDRRLVIVEALGKLSDQEGADELHTLHPLVTESRWLFGPEFDSPEYASNLSLIGAVQAVFKKRIPSGTFLNDRKRPDLVILADATLSAVATDHIDETTGLATIKDILLIELKKGRSVIGREEANQATGYVEDFLSCGLIEGQPFIRSFVVGYQYDPKTQPVRKVENSNGAEVGRITIATYTQLVRTAHRRLFRLREHLSSRYGEVSGPDLLEKVLREPQQPRFPAFA